MKKDIEIEIGTTFFEKWAKSATVGERLRWLLEKRKMKQTELASAIEGTQAAISNIITQASRKPSAPTLLKMAAALQCSAEWIISGDGHPFEINVVGKKAEKDLLDAFRGMDAQAQSALIAAAKAMTRL